MGVSRPTRPPRAGALPRSERVRLRTLRKIVSPDSIRPAPSTIRNAGPSASAACSDLAPRPARPPCRITYNNLHQIVQTPDSVMILNEMVHDARIVRMNAAHLPKSIRRWMGDSVGHWEGDTLVVDTTNFTG